MLIQFSRKGLTQTALAAALLLGGVSGWQINHPAPAELSFGGRGPSGPASSAPAGPVVDAPQTAVGSQGIVVGQSYHNDVSPQLRDLTPQLGSPSGAPRLDVERPLPANGRVDQADSAVQRSFQPFAGLNAPGPNIPAPLSGWEGINAAGSGCNCAPPDTNGDVSLTQYVQTVNTAFAVYSKAGATLLTPRNINTVWSGFGGACETRNDGDPVVLYDPIADRWLLSQFTSAAPYNECVAISTTADATGTWNRYAFQLSATDFPDYPHFGVWPDGYYMSVNWFSGGRTYAGPRPYVFDRAKMLAGQPATFQTTSAALGSAVNPLQPADLDGATQPPSGEANVFTEFGSTLKLFKFHVDWTTPANTTWGQSASVAVAGFTALASNSIVQPGTSTKLDSLGDRLMYRAAYRNMGTYETLVLNHSVNVGTSKRSVQGGVRWYEVRNPAGTASLYQQGTYAPDTKNRWMGSIAMDKLGDIGLGYSVSSSTVYPGLRYTGRLAADPLGTMPQGEGTFYTGVGVQSGVSRWGDYSNMSIDPSDNCTFWFTSEYNNNGGFNWSTRIGTFKFAGCQ